MKYVYVNSVTGNDTTGDGLTWATAKATVAGGIAVMAVDDWLVMAPNHAESSATALTLTFPGTVSNPNFWVCAADTTNAPPIAFANTGSITTTGTSAVAINGCVYVGEFSINVGTGVGAASFTASGNGSDNVYQVYEKTKISLLGTHTTSRIVAGTASSGKEGMAVFKNCEYVFSHTSQGFAPVAMKDLGGKIGVSSVAISSIIATSPASGTYALFENFDATHAATNMNLSVANPVAALGEITFRNLKPPAGWTGGASANAPTNPHYRISLYNRDNLIIDSGAGSIHFENVLVKTGGAFDGTYYRSLKMASNAVANEFIAILKTDYIRIPMDTVGVAKTISFDFLHDSLTALTNADIRLEIDYLGTAGSSFGSALHNGRASLLASAATHASSTAAWTTTGMTNPNKQRLSVTFTPQVAGDVYARVVLTKPSYTIYLDDLPVIS